MHSLVKKEAAMSVQKKSTLKDAYYIIFIIYCIVMLWLLFGRKQYQFNGDYQELYHALVNLRPLKTISAYLYVLENREDAYLRSVAAYNLFGNIALFIPYGIFLPYLFKRLRKCWKVMLLGVITIVCVELLQIITLRGSCDIDDLILNTIGIFIGYLMYRITHLSRE